MNNTYDVSAFPKSVLHLQDKALLEKVIVEGKNLKKNKGDILIRPEDAS